MEKNSVRFLLAFLLLTMLASCGPAKKGMIIDTVVPAQIDLQQAVALDGDPLNQCIAIDAVVWKDRKTAKLLGSALKEALIDEPTFVFNDMAAAKGSCPIIMAEIQDFTVTDKSEQGYQTRRGSAQVLFKLRSTGGNIVAEQAEFSEIVNTKPVGAKLRSKEDISLSLAKKVCQDFVKKLVPTKKKVFREFAKGNQKVEAGTQAAMNGAWDLAIKTWSTVAEEDPQNAPAIYNLGIGYEHKQNLRRALKEYEKALSIDPTNPLYQRTYARVEKRRENVKKIDSVKEKVREESGVGATY